LSVTRGIAVRSLVVLVCLDVGENAGEGQVAAVGHDVLEDVGVAALGGDLIWGEIFDLIQSSQTVREYMDGTRQSRSNLINCPKN
jgi:hypothetical protein